MKKKRQKNPKTAGSQKIERLREGTKERASTWGGKKIKSRSDVKTQLKNYKDGDNPSFFVFTLDFVYLPAII